MEILRNTVTKVGTPFGLDSTNVYKTQNRRTAFIAAALLATWAGYNKFLSNRIGLRPWITNTALLIAETGIIIYNKKWTINKGTDAWQKKESAFIAEDGKQVLDRTKLDQVQNDAKPALEKAWKWPGGLNLEQNDKELKDWTQADMAATMRDETKGVEAYLKWALGALDTPATASKGSSSTGGWRTSSRKYIEDAMIMAINAYRLAMVEVFLEDVPKDDSTPKDGDLRLRTPEEARAYVEGLEQTTRDRLETALVAPYKVYSFARGLASKKPEGVEEQPGYAGDWNSEENAKKFWDADANDFQGKLRDTYNLYAENVQTLAWVQASLTEKMLPLPDTADGYFNVAPFGSLQPKTPVALENPENTEKKEEGAEESGLDESK
jgi:hypothetical protein